MLNGCGDLRMPALPRGEDKVLGDSCRWGALALFLNVSLTLISREVVSPTGGVGGACSSVRGPVPCLVQLMEVFEAEAEPRLLPREVEAPPTPSSPPTLGAQPVEPRGTWEPG